MSTIHKGCADYLRNLYRLRSGGKLLSGHAHEIVAAFFGYATGAALRAEEERPLTSLPSAQLLVPDLALMEERMAQLDDLPEDFRDADDIAEQIVAYLRSSKYFSGHTWWSRDLPEQISAHIHRHPTRLMDQLSGEMADTNAQYGEIDIDEIYVSADSDAIYANLSGTLIGENNEGRAFVGDKIVFTATMTCWRVAGRVGYAGPDFEASGEIDWSDYEGGDDDESQELTEEET